MSAARPFLPLNAFPHHMALQTRWADNDIYGHVNNVAYYSYFDTVVNTTLIEAGVLDIQGGDVIGLVVETGCRYAKSLSYPDRLTIGVGVEKLGRSSVVYRLGVAREGEKDTAAEGRFVHVYVDRASRKPAELPAELRQFLSQLLLDSSVLKEEET